MSTNAIVPRWEWRCFAPSLEALARAAGLPPDAASRESDEIYLLDLLRTENAKIRDEILDIKRLHDIDVDGLELWEPVFKARFPIGHRELAAAFEAFGLHVAAGPRESYAIDQFLAEVIAPRPDFRVVHVHKARRGFTCDRCIAEFVQLKVEGRALESFSLEHEDPALISAALQRLGVDSHGNTSYPTGLKRALGVADVLA